MSWDPPLGEIESVEFSVINSELSKKTAFVNITTDEQLSNGRPVPGGVYDAHLGTFIKHNNCETCNGNKKTCHGHKGVIDLGDARVFSPMFIKHIMRWAKVLCAKCSRVAYSEDEIKKIPLHLRLEKIASMNINTVDEDDKKLKPCIHCKAERYSVKQFKDDKSSLGWNLGKNNLKRIRTREMSDILNRVIDSDVKLMGETTHPKNYILSTIPVSPVNTRPETRAMFSGRVRMNDQTTWLISIMGAIKRGPEMIDNQPDDVLLNQTFYDMVSGSNRTNSKKGKQNIKAIKELIPGKTTGLVRHNMLGRRVVQTLRLVISGDSALQLHQVGLPINEAKKLMVPETVNVNNIDRLKIYFENGTRAYPGALTLLKSNGVVFSLNNNTANAQLSLEIGDVLYRNLIDGDWVLINRAPSLLPSSIVAKEVVIHNDDTMKFNVNLCALYNADFDGDAMTAFIMQSEDAKIEASIVSHVDQFMISHKNSTPIIGQVQDSIIGLAQLSNSNVKYNKLSAMRAIGKTKLNPIFNKNEYTGADLITMSLAGDDISINFTKKPTVFKDENHLPFITPLYKKEDRSVEIKNGVYIGGILDKASIAGGASGGLYHIIYSQYGPRKSLNCIFNMQQLGIAHLQNEEFTVCYGDILPDKGASVKMLAGQMPEPTPTIAMPNEFNISELIQLLEIENNKQVEILNRGDIYAPIGKTISEHFEEIQTNILRILPNIDSIIMSLIDPINNNFYKMISYGSKGKFPNLQLMMTIIGLVLVNEKMPPTSFGYKRSLPYYQRYDMSIYARGFVSSSYKNGISLPGLIYNSMAERHSIIMKALFTAVIGAESRTAIKNLENIVVNNLRQLVNGNVLIQPIYGGDGIDTRKVVSISAPTLLISDAKLEEIYSPGGPEYLNTIKEDRKTMRTSLMTLFNCGNLSAMNGMVSSPVDIGRIIEQMIDKNNHGESSEKMGLVKNNSGESPEKPGLLKDKIKLIFDYTYNELKYIMMNENAKLKEIKVPQYLETAIQLFGILVRSYFTPNVLDKLSINQINTIIRKINMYYSDSLIDYGTAIGIISAQCVSEPLTQYVLHSIHHAVSGGTKKGGVAKLKEIIAPKESNREDSIMTIYLKDDSVSAKWIANNIQFLTFGQFVSSTQLIEEKKYKMIEHPDLMEDKQIFIDFAKYYPLLTPPTNLIKWCLRFIINRENMLLKNISLTKIIDSLRIEYKNAFIVHSDENNNPIIVRMYWSANAFKSTYPDESVMDNIIKNVLACKIRGVEMILNASDRETQSIGISADGSIVRGKEYIINTNGSNVYGVLTSHVAKYIDPLRIKTDSIVETLEIFGVEEAQSLIVEEMRKITPDINPRHLMIYAAEMCSSGVISAIGRIKISPNNILLRIAQASPILSLIFASTHNITAPINGISSALLVGSVPKIGTNYNDIIINEEFVKQHIITETEQIEQMQLLL